MTKRTVQIRNARIVPAETIWPGRHMAADMVLVGNLASPHYTMGPKDDWDNVPIRTSLIVEQRLSQRQVETLNTIYEVVE